MSELKKLEKSDKMLKEIRRKADFFFVSEHNALRGFECIAIMELIDEELERRNTLSASPRFTEEEREAMEFLCQYNLYEKEEQSLLSRPLRLTEAIATVRQMLTDTEIADKGKG